LWSCLGLWVACVSPIFLALLVCCTSRLPLTWWCSVSALIASAIKVCFGRFAFLLMKYVLRHVREKRALSVANKPSPKTTSLPLMAGTITFDSLNCVQIHLTGPIARVILTLEVTISYSSFCSAASQLLSYCSLPNVCLPGRECCRRHGCISSSSRVLALGG